MKSSDFVGGSINTCLYVKKSTKGTVYIALNIDYNLMIGYIAAINDAIEAMKNNGLMLKMVAGLQDYLH